MTGRLEVTRLRRRLDNTFARAPSANTDIEVQADFAKYLCMLVSGFLENAIIALILDTAQRRSAPEVQLFVERTLDHWTNPNVDKICKLLGSFSPDWFRAAATFLVGERKDTINGLVGLRHKIVHGESLGTSMAQVKDYYDAVVEVVEFIADLVDPPQGLVDAG